MQWRGVGGIIGRRITKVYGGEDGIVYEGWLV